MLALEILTLLLDNVTEASVELSINFLKECGQKLTDVSPKGIHGNIYLSFCGLYLKNILSESSLREEF